MAKAVFLGFHACQKRDGHSLNAAVQDAFIVGTPSRELIRRLPKADLHSHIDGSVPARELFRIARKNRRKVFTPSGAQIESEEGFIRFVKGGGYDTLLDYIVERFFPITGLMQTEPIIEDVGLAYVKELSHKGIAYAEGRFAPQYHTREGMTLDQVIESMRMGLAKGQEKYGVRVNLIVAIGREVDPRRASEVARAATRNRHVVGLDLGGTEEGRPPEMFRNAFRIASHHRLGTTVHAGEWAGSRSQNLGNVRAAILKLNARRVGHAVDLSQDGELVELARERSTVIEMNPVSNLLLGRIRTIEELGINRLLARGVIVTVNTDDPALWSGGSLNDVLFETCRASGLGLDGLDRLVVNAFEGAFTSASEKQALSEEYARVRRRFA